MSEDGRRVPGGALHLRRAGVLLIVVAIAASLVVPIVLGGKQALAALLHVSMQGYSGLLSLIVASWLARAVKLRLLLRQLGAHPGMARTWWISLATDFAFVTTPAGVGGYVASVYYLRSAGGASGSGATTITAVDQGLDLVFFAFAVPIAGLALVWSGQSYVLTSFAFGATALTALLVVVAWFARHRVARWTFEPNVLTLRWPSLREKQRVLHRFCAKIGAHGALMLAGGPLFLSSTIGLTAVQWLTRYGVLWLALHLLGYDVAFALVFLLQVLVLHAALWTGVPAGGGGAEIGLSATLALWVPPTSLATALLLWRALTLYTGLAAGALAIALLARRERHAAAHGPDANVSSTIPTQSSHS
ncbi:MAG: lysylphosphatidylglycerol synthase transmembrane domain-containing protein [Dokdonella sp.]